MKTKILIVDDEHGIVDMIQSYFQKQYDILTAYSGQEALQKIASNPDLILLDINMPDIDGLTVCQKVRDYITCPILFLTASEFMSLCGAWMGTETAIQLWSTFGKYALNLQHIHCTITLKRFGGVVIGGTPKKYGTKEIFPAIIPLLFGSGISPAWGSYLPLPRH